MQRRQHLFRAALSTVTLVATIAPAVPLRAEPSRLRIRGSLNDSESALSRLVEQMLGARPLTAAARAQLLRDAAGCDPAPQAGAQPGAVAAASTPPPGSEDLPRDDEPTTRPSDAGPATALEEGCADLPSSFAPPPSDKLELPSRDTVRRWINLLIVEQLGYCVRDARPHGDRVDVELRRHRVVRKVSVKGNWPIFEEEFLRRLSLRPGQRVPEGSDLTQLLAGQKERLQRFLARRGYFEGKLTIRITPARANDQVNVHLRIDKGKSYKIGEVRVEPLGRQSWGSSDSADVPWEPAVPRAEIEDLFRDYILFYRRGFNTARCRQHVQELIKRYHQRGYPGVRIKDDCTRLPKQLSTRGVRVTLQIQERKQIVVQYRGNTNLSDAELDEVLTLDEAGAYDNYELEQSALQIHKKYQSEGFLQARVHFSRQNQPSRDLVTFHVHEGPHFRVRRVDFSGNTSVQADELRALVRTKTYPFLGLGEGGYVTDVQLKQDAQRIAELYRARGFSQVRVRAQLAPHRELLGRPAALAAVVATRSAEDDEDLYARFEIEEGPRTSVRRVEIHGNRLFSTRELHELMRLRAGETFSGDLLAADQARIKRLYFENGHPYAQVGVSCLKLDATRRRVELLRLRIVEGHPVRFASILLRGNFRTRASVIRSALNVRPGDSFDIRALERGELVLRQIGVFNSVRIQVLGLQARLAEVPLLVSIEERYDDYGAIELGVGGSTDNSVFGALGYNWRNALGLGASLAIRGEFGPQIQSGNLDASYPRAFGSAFGLDFQLFVRNELTERLGPLLTFGGTLTLSRELLRDLRALVSYALRQVETDEDLNRPAGSFDESRFAPVSTRTGSLGTSLIYDKRDNPLAPSRGYRLAGSVTWASEAFAGTADFLTLRLNAQAYVPLPLDVTIAFGLRYDHGVPLAGAPILPRVERFFAGGDTTIRGFEEDRAFAERIESPLSPFVDASVVRLVPQGGNIRMLTNVELQFPILKELPLIGLPLMGALFSDNGVVSNSFDRFDVREFRHSLGGALRLVTLVGFLSVEYAVPLDPEVGDPVDGRFHINFGFIF